MALLPTSNLTFYNKDYEVIDKLREWEKGFISINGDCQEWEKYSLMINNKNIPISLKFINSSKRMMSDAIRLGTGHYKIKVVLGDSFLTITEHVVSSKITEEEFAKMIDELAFQLPADISISLSELGAYTGTQVLCRDQVTVAQEFLKLKNTINGTDSRIGLLEIIKRISMRPFQVLQSKSLVVRRENARRFDSTNLIQAYLKSGNIDINGVPIKVRDNRSEPTYNTYENQFIKLFIQQVRIRLRRFLKIAIAINNKQLLNEVVYLKIRLDNTIKKTKFLNDVEMPTHFTFKVTKVLLNIPAYKALLDEYMRFQRVITSNINDPLLDSPLENTPSLYQKWGTLMVLSMLLTLAGREGYIVKDQSLISSVNGGKVIRIIPNGKPILILQHPEKGTYIRVIPERSYVKTGSPFRSVSFTQKPDLAIEVTTPDQKHKIYIFDPKYKLDSEDSDLELMPVTTKPKKVDIDKMHSYRDAIRDAGGNRIVSYAAILYPGETYDFDHGLGAIQAIPSMGLEMKEEIKTVLMRILRN